MSTEVLRFAPSPTGGFHVGNAQTALFNYLYARHYGASLKLRIEDTDASRSTEDSLKTITDGLDWLGITFDGEPVFQSRNETSHRGAAERLLASGAAYKFYATAEELEEIRRLAQKEKRATRYPRQGGSRNERRRRTPRTTHTGSAGSACQRETISGIHISAGLRPECCEASSMALATPLPAW